MGIDPVHAARRADRSDNRVDHRVTPEQIASIWALIRNPLPKMYPLNAPEKRCNRKRKRFHD